MKNPGRLLLALTLLLTATWAGAATELQTSLQKNTIAVGESTVLQVKLPGDASSAKPVEYPSVPGIEISYSGMQRSFEYINGKTWSGVTLNFTVTAMRKGNFAIPPFRFKDGDTVFQSRRVNLLVTGGGAAPDETAAPGRIRSLVDISKNRAYAGEPVIMRYFILAAGTGVQLDGFEKPPETKGFIIKEINEKIGSEVVTRDGVDYVKSHIITFFLVPAAPGNYRVGGGTAVVSTEERRGGSPFGPFSMFPFKTQRRLYFDEEPITVSPLPDDGRPENYRGDIGRYSIKADFSGDPVDVYGEKRIEVTVTGTGNILTLSPPVSGREPSNMKILSEDGEADFSLENDRLSGTKKFVFTAVPEEAGTCDLGSFTLAFFNPESGKYETVETEPVRFQARGDADKNRMEFDSDEKNRVDFNVFYIAGVLALLAGSIILVIIWERRRISIVAGEDETGGEVETDEKERIDEELPLLMENLRKPVNSGDFINTANRVLALLEKRASDRENAGEILGSIERIREENYRYKFGGRQITGPEMEQVSFEINDLYRDVTRSRR